MVIIVYSNQISILKLKTFTSNKREKEYDKIKLLVPEIQGESFKWKSSRRFKILKLFSNTDGFSDKSALSGQCHQSEIFNFNLKGMIIYICFKFGFIVQK